jgi:uncharacterized membrane protein
VHPVRGITPGCIVRSCSGITINGVVPANILLLTGVILLLTGVIVILTAIASIIIIVFVSISRSWMQGAHSRHNTTD